MARATAGMRTTLSGSVSVVGVFGACPIALLKGLGLMKYITCGSRTPLTWGRFFVTPGEFASWFRNRLMSAGLRWSQVQKSS